MRRPRRTVFSSSAERLLLTLADATSRPRHARGATAASPKPQDVAALIAADLLARGSDGTLVITDAGRAHARRQIDQRTAELDPFLAQHLEPERRTIVAPEGRVQVLVDDAESPLVWLSRRTGRDGRHLIAPEQLVAGERLRAEFTRAQLTPRVTSNWSAAVSRGRRQAGAAQLIETDAVIAARHRVCEAMDAVGPEFAGLLLDVCCFLKKLEEIERERRWPLRSGKVVLQLGLDRLARHYGITSEARGRAYAPVRAWLAPDTELAPANNTD